jgi:hypothetical protein
MSTKTSQGYILTLPVARLPSEYATPPLALTTEP